ncbi:efflux RND transporter periplasmic adaptor subunit [Rudanella paleaurantiibacter]|uniref:Efflux RND transporter periplasmic adaptor subunit n=1 Tax=Rudanella paleaurantiibacter TaxID=2614655 RepID=A0A7J5U2B0_9BACT|nr:efflux RND transporter periplasmic adaptor subunit [Rudanella paleaurantiibacter]KAB7731939.1 efflux RND transporter periplasmic adaptor subunit [Rudanella paleaurantiibacter]
MNYLLTLSLALLIWACGSKAEAPNQTAATDNLNETVVPVRLAPVQVVQRAEPIRVSGLLSSAEEARLSFKIGGIINRTYVEEGQTVRKGQLLATLDLTEINAQVNQAELAAEKSERDLSRVKALYADTAATLEQMQNATTGSRLARQNLTVAQFNRSYAQIRSSVDGTVTRKLMTDGELAAPGAPVFMVLGNRPNDWVVRVGVSDKDWARLRLGNRATVTLDAYLGQVFRGVVTELAGAADPMNKLYEVEIRIDPGKVRFAPGLFAKVQLTPDQSRSYALVPVEAIVEGNGQEGFVYVLTPDRRGVRKQPIQIGYLDGSNVLLTNGLANTREVVTAGSAFLTEESKVKVMGTK